MPWDFVLILVVLGIAVPWRGAVRMRQLLARGELSSADRLALYASTIIFQWLATGIVLWRCFAHHIPAADLALAVPRPWLTLVVALALTSLLTANQIISVRRLAHTPPERRGFLGIMARKVMPQTTVERLGFLALVVTVSLCEEILYRGFIHAVFQNLAAGSLVVGVAASAVFFASAHLYQGRRGIATTFVAGLVFSGVRVWTGSLLPSILGHFAADLAAGLSAPKLLRAPAHESEKEATSSAVASSDSGLFGQ